MTSVVKEEDEEVVEEDDHNLEGMSESMLGI